ncbi:MAG: YraN family protein [Anaerolineae bacterium]|nr:YraN family protein [Anaerolineae bacterium]
MGARGEELVAAYLRTQGYTILARNWRCAQGEVDIVAQDGATLVIVEVRTRRSLAFGSPEESVNESKQARLRALAEAVVQSRDWQGPWRIDVVAVDLTGGRSRVRLLTDAVEG